MSTHPPPISSQPWGELHKDMKLAGKEEYFMSGRFFLLNLIGQCHCRNGNTQDEPYKKKIHHPYKFKLKVKLEKVNRERKSEKKFLQK